MISKDLLKEVIIRQKSVFLNTTGAYDRQILSNNQFKKSLFQTSEIVIITGVRRAGKSYLMRLIWQDIKNNKKLTNNQVLYFNFEDEKLISFRAKDFDLLLESHLELLEPDENKDIYLFFDEIQNINGWDKFLNRLRENKKYKIFVTGSNATMLSKEISSKLTGRNIQIYLYPFSWYEFLKTQIIDFKENDLYDREKRIKVFKFFNQYLKFGGFPEVIITKQRFLLQEYLKNIIYRDIVSRYKIKYEMHLREIVSFLITNITNKVSLKNIAKMTGIKNINTIKNYLNYLENSFLFYSMPMYSYSIKQQIYNPDKLYICDLGVYNELSFKFSENKGQILENFVFMELKRKNKNIYYGEDKKYQEIDFVIIQKNKVCELIQCTCDINNSLTKKMELESLKKAMDNFKLKKGIVITYDFDGQEKIKGGVIYFIPAWKYFLMK
ncbi:MAG: ATP-binding protein [Patescibacteria group bacterium]